MYDFPQRGKAAFIDRPVDVYFQFVKTKKNRPTDIEVCLTYVPQVIDNNALGQEWSAAVPV